MPAAHLAAPPRREPIPATPPPHSWMESRSSRDARVSAQERHRENRLTQMCRRKRQRRRRHYHYVRSTFGS